MNDQQLTTNQRKDLEEKYMALAGIEQQYPEVATLRPLLKTNPNEFRLQYPTVLIGAVSKALGLPRQAIDIMGGKPYINKTGLLLKVQKDPRKVKLIDAQYVVLPIEIGDNIKIDSERHPYFMGFSKDGSCIAKGIVEFQDGSIFRDNGTANPKYLNREWGKMHTMIPYVVELACTRATNRAMRMATGIGLLSVEELNERGFQIVEEKAGTTDTGGTKIHLVNEVEKLLAMLNFNSAQRMALVNKYGASDLEFLTVTTLERVWKELRAQCPVKKARKATKKARKKHVTKKTSRKKS